MEDEQIREQTASERLSLEEEEEMQSEFDPASLNRLVLS